MNYTHIYMHTHTHEVTHIVHTYANTQIRHMHTDTHTQCIKEQLRYIRADLVAPTSLCEVHNKQDKGESAIERREMFCS